MHILQLGKFYPIRGGVEKVMWDLTRGLGEQGVCCEMLCAFLRGEAVDHEDLAFLDESSRDALCGGCFSFRLNECSRVHCIPALRKAAGTMLAPMMPLALRTLLRRAESEGNPFDIVHIHHPDPMAALSLRLSGFKGKVVLHWHSDIIKQKNLLKLYKPLQNWLIRRADRIVGTSPVYVKESPHLKGQQDKLCCLPIGVAPVKPDNRGVEKIRSRFKGRKIVFSLGRLVPYKGFRYLIEAAQYLPDDFVVIIGGQGPLRDELQNLVKSLHLEGKVRLLGWVEQVEQDDWYGAAELFVLSSCQKTEAFGIVQIEAMSCGTPVVATEIPGSGVAWVNAHGVSGLNVPVGSPVALAEAIMAVSRERGRFSAGAQRRYEEFFTSGQMISNCIEIYRGLYL